MFGQLIYAIVLLGLIVAAAGVVTRVVPRRLTDIVFTDTDVEHAAIETLDFANGVYEGHLGYPSGFFYVDDDRSDFPRRLHVEEAQPAGSIVDGCSASVGVVASAGFEGGGLYGCVWFLAVITIGSPLFIISGLDRLYRFCLKSRIIITLRQSGANTTAEIDFYGASGYLVVGRYKRALSAPDEPTFEVAP